MEMSLDKVLSQIRVLIVEDDIDLRETMVANLQSAGFAVASIADGRELFQQLQQNTPNVILMDQMMPGKSGTDLIAELRTHKQYGRIPIIMVTGLNSEEEKVAALLLGADDYLTKPFSTKELQARIQALVRRALTDTGKKQNYVYHDILVDQGAHKVTRAGQVVALTLTEYKIFVELLAVAGQVLSRDSLRERALGNMTVTDRTIDVHMASLRKKMGDLGEHIETVRGVGYRMAPETKLVREG